MFGCQGESLDHLEMKLSHGLCLERIRVFLAIFCIAGLVLSNIIYDMECHCAGEHGHT